MDKSWCFSYDFHSQFLQRFSFSTSSKIDLSFFVLFSSYTLFTLEALLLSLQVFSLARFNEASWSLHLCDRSLPQKNMVLVSKLCKMSHLRAWLTFWSEYSCNIGKLSPRSEARTFNISDSSSIGSPTLLASGSMLEMRLGGKSSTKMWHFAKLWNQDHVLLRQRPIA